MKYRLCMNSPLHYFTLVVLGSLLRKIEMFYIFVKIIGICPVIQTICLQDSVTCSSKLKTK